MRKVFALMVAATLVFGAFGGDAVAGKKKKKKVVRKTSAPYSAPALGVPGASVCSPGTIGCVSFPTGAKERYVSVEISDQTGLSVPAEVTQDLDGDGFADTSSSICGTSEAPIVIEPGYEVTVFIYANGGANACAGAGTAGDIAMKFSNRP